MHDRKRDFERVGGRQKKGLSQYGDRWRRYGLACLILQRVITRNGERLK
jgi:hypothetical protein